MKEKKMTLSPKRFQSTARREANEAALATTEGARLNKIIEENQADITSIHYAETSIAEVLRQTTLRNEAQKRFNEIECKIFAEAE